MPEYVVAETIGEGRAGSKVPRALFLTALNRRNCAVSDFTRHLRSGLERLAGGSSIDFPFSRRPGLWRDYRAALSRSDMVVVNFPVVDWKRLLVSPSAALLLARLKGRRTVLVMHEWSSLNPLRRLTYLPALLIADRIVMMSALVRAELAAVPLIGVRARTVRLIPLPPNLQRPQETRPSLQRDEILAARAQGRIILAQFGSIYPGKQPKALLEVGAELKRRGEKPLLVLIGSFVRDIANSEADFWRAVEAGGLRDDVLVTGFVDTMEQLYGLFEEVDVFLYPFDEGMTARRSSVLATLQSGRPIVTTSPQVADEFDDHPRLRALIDAGVLHFVPRGASPAALADAVSTVCARPRQDVDVDVTAWWDEAVAKLLQVL